MIEGTADPVLTSDTVWREYEFKGKPGDVKRRPPQVAPYHLRLDWLMWFAALSPAYAESWFMPFLVKVLEGDGPTLKLLRHNPFPTGPPAFLPACRSCPESLPPSRSRCSPRPPPRAWRTSRGRSRSSATSSRF